jgi:hypothetical protein
LVHFLVSEEEEEEEEEEEVARPISNPNVCTLKV